MPLTPALRSALLLQTCCGMQELCDFLTDEIDFIYDCQDDGCTLQLRYLHTHLALIEAAQIFARNKVDTTTRVFMHNTQERYNAFSQRDTNAESTATGRSCQWAAATSAQNFNRDSTDDTVSFSEQDLLHTAERVESGYDKSCRHTVGHGFHFSHILHTLTDLQGERFRPNAGRVVTTASRASSTSGGTDFLLPLLGTKWTATPTIDTNPPFIHIVGEPGPYLPVSFPPSSEAICPPFDPDDPIQKVCPVPGYPSYGNGFHGKFRFSVSIGIPALGSLSIAIEFDRGRNERQYYHCSSSIVTGRSDTAGRADGQAESDTVADPGENRTSSRETTNVYHLVRKYGTSTRRGTTSTDAEEVQDGVSRGIAHSESARDTKGQSFQQRRAEALTVSHTESHLRRTEKLTDDERRDKFGQISDHLKALWKRVWDRSLLLEKQLASSKPLGASMACPPNRRLGCACPQRRSYQEILDGHQLSRTNH
jgi:hypothetical protein